MDQLREVLRQVQDGKRRFLPDSSTPEALSAFQVTAAAIRRANEIGYFTAIFQISKMKDTYGYTREAIVTSPLSYEALQLLGASATEAVTIELTGWQRVDRIADSLRDRLVAARNEEDYQAVGLLSRELLISLAQEVYVRERYPPLDGTEPSESDAKRMLEAYIAVELAGSANESARRQAKSAVDFSNALQHRRTATFREAKMCVEATMAVFSLIAIIAGKRDPQ